MKKLLIGIAVLLLTGCFSVKTADTQSNIQQANDPVLVMTVDIGTLDKQGVVPVIQTAPVNTNVRLEKFVTLFHTKLHGKVDKGYLRKVIHVANKMADKYPFVETELVLAVIWQESRFKQRASFKGSEGLMQVERKSHLDKLKGRDIYGIWVNIPVGCQILEEYHSRFKSTRATLLAYNAGPSNYQKGRFKEAYATEVIALYRQLKKV